jgi:hypothetical protein
VTQTASSGRRSPLRPLCELAQAHPVAQQPDALLGTLAETLQEAVGYKLFTVLEHDAAHGSLRRIFSSRPDINPVGGTKPITESNWMTQVLLRAEPYIGRTREDLQEVFFDHELLASIGCESVLNMPVVWAGKVLGSLNLLHGPCWYDVRDVPTVRVFAQLTLPALMKP